MSRLLHKCSLLRYKKISINNKKIIIPLIQGMGFANLLRTEVFMNTIIQKISEIKKGAFVDVGVHQDGLAHISELSDTFVRNPHDVLKVHQKVMVSIIDVDLERNRTIEILD